MKLGFLTAPLSAARFEGGDERLRRGSTTTRDVLRPYGTEPGNDDQVIRRTIGKSKRRRM